MPSFYFFKYLIYLFDRETHTARDRKRERKREHKQGEWEREKQTLH